MLSKLMDEKVITIGGKEYKLREVTKEELFEHRLSNKPGLVFKDNDKLWYTELPNDKVRFKDVERKSLRHMCSSDYECCSRLSALPDPQGCACVRDESFGPYRRAAKFRTHLCKVSLRIEKYSFLTYAIETFNMVEDCLKVLSCKNCSRSKVKPMQMDIEEKRKKVLALAQNLNPDIEKMSDLNRFAEPKMKF